MARQLRLAFVVAPSDNPEASRDFYARLGGDDFQRSLWSVDGFHSSVAGIDLDIERRHSPLETTTPYYAVDDLDGTLREATAGGASVVFGPSDMRMPERHLAALRQVAGAADEAEGVAALGRVAVIVDPGGGQLGLVQLSDQVAGRSITEFQQTVIDRFPGFRMQDA